MELQMIGVSFIESARFIRQRCRTEQHAWVSASMALPFTVAAEDEAPVVCRVQTTSEKAVVTVRKSDGRYYGSIADESGGHLTVEALTAMAASPDHDLNPFICIANPQYARSYRPTPDEVLTPEGLSIGGLRSYDTDRETCEANLRRMAADRLIVGGVVHAACAEPVLTAHPDVGAVRVQMRIEGDVVAEPAETIFRIDRLGDAAAWTAAAWHRRSTVAIGHVVMPAMVDVPRPDLLERNDKLAFMRGILKPALEGPVPVLRDISRAGLDAFADMRDSADAFSTTGELHFAETFMDDYARLLEEMRPLGPDRSFVPVNRIIMQADQRLLRWRTCESTPSVVPSP